MALSVANGHAQTTDARAPAGAVYGGAEGRAPDKEKFNLLVDLNESYDQNVTVRSGDVAFSPFQASGFYTVFTPTLEYDSQPGRHIQVGFTAASNVRHYNELDQTMVTNHALGASMSAGLGKKTVISFNEGVTYAPAQLYGLLTGSALSLGAIINPEASNYSLDNTRSYSSDTAAKLTRKLNDRLTLSFESDARFTNYIGSNSRYPDIRTKDAGAQFSYGLSRSTGLRFGYTYRQAEYVGAPVTTEQNFVLGVDHTRMLSRTRRTTFAATMGATLARAPLAIASADLRQQYRLIGDASVNHQIGRTWSVQGAYHRGIGYIQGFQAPVFTDAYSAGATGFLSRRMDVTMSAAYSTGEAALTGAQSQFTTYTGDARLRYAVTRMWATYFEYLFYYYDFNQTLVTPLGLPPSLTRNGVRMGVTLWVPMRHR
jgi:hypothetical protein